MPTPDPQGRFVFVALVSVPVPVFDASEAPPCLRRRLSWVARSWARGRPRTRARTCCWFHGGDWTTVLDTALAGQAEAVADRSGLTGWEREALESLLDPESAIVLDDNSEEGVWIYEGRHRIAAMCHAGARYIIAAEPLLP